MVDWDKRFIELSEFVSSWSKDKSIGICAIIATKEHRVVSMGYNGFPSGADDSIEERYERPTKYLYTEHAERNAIYSAARQGISLNGCTIYHKWFPCADCARAIIQSGIDTVVCEEPDLTTPKWGEHFKAALEMFKECGITIRYYNK
ncbi:MAG: deoxycytidylate deaminase [bacterium]